MARCVSGNPGYIGIYGHDNNAWRVGLNARLYHIEEEKRNHAPAHKIKWLQENVVKFCKKMTKILGVNTVKEAVNVRLPYEYKKYDFARI